MARASSWAFMALSVLRLDLIIELSLDLFGLSGCRLLGSHADHGAWFILMEVFDWCNGGFKLFFQL